MARRWRWLCGWEHGGLRRLSNPVSTAQAGKEDSWSGGVDHPFDLTNVRTGKWSFKAAVAGLSSAGDVVGHVEARGQRYLFFHTPLALAGFQVRGDVSVGDTYVMARFSQHFDTVGKTDKRYFTSGITITAISPDIKVKIRVSRMKRDGTLDQEDIVTGSTEFSLSSTFIVPVVGLDTTDRKLKLFVNGSQEGSTIDYSGYSPADIHEEPHILHDNRHVSPTGSDAGANVWFDGWGACDDDTDTVPPTATEIQLYQPFSVVQNEWPGAKYCDVDDENDADLPDTGDQDTNKITPTSIGQKQTFGFPNWAGGTLEGVRIVYGGNGLSGKTAKHKLLARTTGGSLIDLSAAVGTGGNNLWNGRNLSLTPEGAVWDTAKFNALEAGLEAIAGLEELYEFYVMVVGQSLTRGAVTPSGACSGIVTHTPQIHAYPGGRSGPPGTIGV